MNEGTYKLVGIHANGRRGVAIRNAIGVPSAVIEDVCEEVEGELDLRTVKNQEILGTMDWDGENATWELEN